MALNLRLAFVRSLPCLAILSLLFIYFCMMQTDILECIIGFIFLLISFALCVLAHILEPRMAPRERLRPEA